MEKPAPKIAVFISGTGTNLRALIDAGKKGKLDAEIALVVSSSPQAGGLSYAEKVSLPTFVFQEKEYPSKIDATEALLEKLRQYKIDFIALAGYLKLIAPGIIAAFPD